MYTLSIDTTHYTSVAISLGKKIVAHKRIGEQFGQAESLAILINGVLESEGLTYEDIDYVAITVGPGSFTGIRAGIAAVNAIKLARPEVKLICMTNFSILKHRAQKQVAEYDFIAAITGWLPDKGCIKVYDQSNVPTFDPTIVEYAEVPRILSQLYGTVICVGEGLRHCYQELASMPNMLILPRFVYADAKTISDIAYKYINKYKFVDEISPFDPYNPSIYD